MSGSYALTVGEGLKVHRPAPIVLYDDRRFGSFSVAEPDSSDPASFDRLLRFLMRRGRSREDAEDLIQEAMLRLHTYAREGVQNKEAFLRRAVRNLAIDQFRRDRSRLQGEVPIEDIDRQSPLIAPGPTPDQILDDQQRLDGLIARLDAVSPRTREIYMPHRLGYSYAEIGSHMRIAVITIKRHIARARAALMKVDV
jgi:RNA polymerase sigma-70 factor (ECF subfamily)